MTQLFLYSWQSITCPFPQASDTSLTVLTALHYLTMFSVKCYTCYSVHNGLLLEHFLSQIINCYSVQNSPLLDHVLSQVVRLLLCSQHSTTWSCSEPNYTPFALFTTVHHLTMFSAKWYIYYCVQYSPPIDYILCQIIPLILCSYQSTILTCVEANESYLVFIAIPSKFINQYLGKPIRSLLVLRLRFFSATEAAETWFLDDGVQSLPSVKQIEYTIKRQSI
jgi:hypothetical protein